MNSIQESVTRIAGHRSRRPYKTLVQAVAVAMESLPEEPLMAEICVRTGRRCRKEPGTVSQDLSRATLDIWENGDREALVALLGRDPLVKPTPRDFVLELGQLFRDRE